MCAGLYVYIFLCMSLSMVFANNSGIVGYYPHHMCEKCGLHFQQCNALVEWNSLSESFSVGILKRIWGYWLKIQASVGKLTRNHLPNMWIRRFTSISYKYTFATPASMRMDLLPVSCCFVVLGVFLVRTKTRFLHMSTSCLIAFHSGLHQFRV